MKILSDQNIVEKEIEVLIDQIDKISFDLKVLSECSRNLTKYGYYSLDKELVEEFNTEAQLNLSNDNLRDVWARVNELSRRIRKMNK